MIFQQSPPRGGEITNTNPTDTIVNYNSKSCTYYDLQWLNIWNGKKKYCRYLQDIFLTEKWIVSLHCFAENLICGLLVPIMYLGLSRKIDFIHSLGSWHKKKGKK